MPILAHASLDFRRELRAGDEVTVEVWPASYGNTSMKLGYRLRREADDTTIATGARVWLFIDLEGNNIPVPAEIRGALGRASESD